MRIALALLAALLVAPAALAQPTSSRASAVVDGLGVDDKTAHRLVELLTRYDQEVDRLRQQRNELKRRLVAAKHENPKDVERLLDDAVANQRALVDADERLINRLRTFISPRLTAQALVLLSVTEPTTEVSVVRADERRSRDPDALWPPHSPVAACDPFSSMHRCGQCDPFESMHGCR